MNGYKNASTLLILHLLTLLRETGWDVEEKLSYGQIKLIKQNYDFNLNYDIFIKKNLNNEIKNI